MTAQPLTANAPVKTAASFTGHTLMRSYTPLEDREPELSFFPDPKKTNPKKLLSRFPEHMEKVLRKPSKAENRRFREFAITFALDMYDGNNTPYNFRMRAFLQPMPDGNVIFSNVQFTVKNKGNDPYDRREFETRDALPSADLEAAIIALKEQYGSQLPTEIASINPEQFFVSGICINARIGKNGIYNSGNTIIPEFNALAMYNSDFVLFTTPEILDQDGNLVDLGLRLEAEIELKKVETDPKIINMLARLYGDNHDTAVLKIYERALDDLGIHAKGLIQHETPYTTGKVDEAIQRAEPHLIQLKRDWGQSSLKRGKLPADYLEAGMQPALKALISAVPSPYKNHQKEMVRRERFFNDLRASGQREANHKGYHLALTG